jgi:galactokinase
LKQKVYLYALKIFNLSDKMIKDIFRSKFGKEPLVVRSPGRINLIGEHTDYNEGFVLPAAIDKFCTVAVSESNDDMISLFAIQYNQLYEVKVSDIRPVKDSWTNYVLGVVDQLIKRGYRVSGFNMVIDGDVPVGAGLSSSAAIECAVCFALSELFSLHLSKLDIALISQKAEHTYPGVQCGIMDQFASTFGKKDHALKLDCRSLEYEEVPLELEGYKIVLLNTNVKHSLTTTAYNERRQQCGEGVAMVQKHVDGISTLRDVTVDMAEKFINDPLIFQRCNYVIRENARVIASVQHMRNGNITGLGEQMFLSHTGLSREYEVSCPELDYLVDAVKHNPLVAGARMMGGGFGGCTINIVREGAVEELVSYLAENYQREMGKPLTVYVAQTANGTEPITNKTIA